MSTCNEDIERNVVEGHRFVHTKYEPYIEKNQCLTNILVCKLLPTSNNSSKLIHVSIDTKGEHDLAKKVAKKWTIFAQNAKTFASCNFFLPKKSTINPNLTTHDHIHSNNRQHKTT